MSKREDEDFERWQEEIVGGFPEEQRESVQAILATDAGREQFYRGTLRSKEFHRRLNEVDSLRKELESAQEDISSYYEEESSRVESLEEELAALRAERDKLKTSNVGEGDPPPAVGNPGFSAEEFAELKAKANRIEALDKVMPAVLADMSKIAIDAQKNGFEYDPHELMRFTLQEGVEPWKAYLYQTREQREAKYKEEKESEKNKWIEEGKRLAAAARNGSPDALQPAGPIWEQLTKKDAEESTSNDRVGRALEMFSEMGGTAQDLQ